MIGWVDERMMEERRNVWWGGRSKGLSRQRWRQTCCRLICISVGLVAVWMRVIGGANIGGCVGLFLGGCLFFVLGVFLTLMCSRVL